MATHVEVADNDVKDVMDRVIDRHESFAPIRREEVRIEVMAVSKEKGPALRVHGSPALAKIKVSSQEDRAIGGPDVWIWIDARRWGEIGVRAREALFAHELQHLIVSRKRDEHDRPVIKLRPDDWTINGFRDVAQWYGEDAIEIRSLRAVNEFLRQGSLFSESTDDSTRRSQPEVSAATVPAGKKRGRPAKEKGEAAMKGVDPATYLVFNGSGDVPLHVIRAHSLAAACDLANAMAEGEYSPRLVLDQAGRAKLLNLEEFIAPTPAASRRTAAS